MDQARLFQDGQGIQQLRSKHLDELQTESAELVVLDEFVQVGRQAFKYDAQVLVMNELVAHTQNVMLVFRIGFAVELRAQVQVRVVTCGRELCCIKLTS